MPTKLQRLFGRMPQVDSLIVVASDSVEFLIFCILFLKCILCSLFIFADRLFYATLAKTYVHWNRQPLVRSRLARLNEPVFIPTIPSRIVVLCRNILEV
jgi:hypothetical protein